MTGKQLDNIVDTFVHKEKRMPTRTEILDVANDNTKGGSAAAAIARYRKAMKVLHVIEGQVYDASGEMLWHQVSPGSLMPARYYPDTGMGQTISG